MKSEQKKKNFINERALRGPFNFAACDPQGIRIESSYEISLLFYSFDLGMFDG